MLCAGSSLLLWAEVLFSDPQGGLKVPRRGACPGESIYDKGSVWVQGQGATQADAENVRDAQMAQAKQDALDEQTASFRAALAVGDAACKPGVPPCDPCSAVFWGPPLNGPWRASATLHHGVWKARGLTRRAASARHPQRAAPARPVRRPGPDHRTSCRFGPRNQVISSRLWPAYHPFPVP